MAERPFVCPKCGNWYTPIDHVGACTAVHSPRGCCHFGHQSSSDGERLAGQILAKATTAQAVTAGFLANLPSVKTKDDLDKRLQAAQAAVAAAEAAVIGPGVQLGDTIVHQGLDYALRISGTFVYPGRDDGKWDTITGIEEVVQLGRRPPEDLAAMKRSVIVTKLVAGDVPPAMAEAKRRLVECVAAAALWQAPPEPEPLRAIIVERQVAPVASNRTEAQRQVARERMAKARAGRKQKEAVAAPS